MQNALEKVSEAKFSFLGKYFTPKAGILTFLTQFECRYSLGVPYYFAAEQNKRDKWWNCAVEADLGKWCSVGDNTKIGFGDFY